jgi:hypothetical protein
MLVNNDGSRIILIGLLSIFGCITAYAEEHIEIDGAGQPVIVTTVPAPKEIIVVPGGYISCFTVPSGWNFKNVWVAEHKVCQYSPKNGSKSQGVAWVDSYWACTKYRSMEEPKQGECTNWQWQPAHWVKTLDVY